MSAALATSIDEITFGTDGRGCIPAEIFDEFAVPIWAVAMQALDEEYQADEVVEATFATFARSPGSLAAAGNPGLLLFAATRRLTFERLSSIDRGGPRLAPPASVSGQRWRSALALGCLSELELAVARLRHEHGLRTDAIAFQLGRAPDVIERSIQQVGVILGDQFSTDGGLFEALRPPDPMLRRRVVEGRGPVDVGVTAERPAGWFNQSSQGPPPSMPLSTKSASPWAETSDLPAGAASTAAAIDVGGDPTQQHPLASWQPATVVPEHVLRRWDPPPFPHPAASTGSQPESEPDPPSPADRLGAISDPGPSTGPTRIQETASAFWSNVGPGLVLAVMGATSALMLQQFVPGVSALVLAVLVGVVVGNLGIATEGTAAGLAFAAKRLLRIGVVLLGLRLSVGDVFSLGVPALLLVAVTVVVTFFGVQWLGARLGLSPGLSLLVATGYSICGASAIAAVEGSIDADEEEVAASIGLVTLAGSLAIVVVPTIAGLLGLSEAAAGAWAGASIHDVAQVVAAGSAIGTTALATAVVVKLTRIVLLAPIVAGLNATRSRRQGVRADSRRPPILPLFVIGFLTMMTVRTIGVLPLPVIDFARSVEGLLFTVALVGLGANVRLAKLRTLGPRPLLLGGLAWALIGTTSLIGVSIVY